MSYAELTISDRIQLQLDDLTRAERILGEALRAADRLDRDISLARALETSPGWRQAPAAERRLVTHLVNSTLEQEYGCLLYTSDAADDTPCVDPG